jgi:hypothetical protein
MYAAILSYDRLLPVYHCVRHHDHSCTPLISLKWCQQLPLYFDCLLKRHVLMCDIFHRPRKTGHSTSQSWHASTSTMCKSG